MPGVGHAFEVGQGTGDRRYHDPVFVHGAYGFMPIVQAVFQGFDDFRYREKMRNPDRFGQECRMEESEDFRADDTASFPDAGNFRKIDVPVFHFGCS